VTTQQHHPPDPAEAIVICGARLRAGDDERWVDLAEGYEACPCQGHESLIFCGSGYTNIDALIEEGRRFRHAFDCVSAPDNVSTT
jgi:hypothetical protein